MKTKLYCQGDVMVRPVVEIPAGVAPIAPDAGRIILAYGELTGHAHALDPKLATLFGLNDRRFLDVVADAELRHEEHDTIVLPPGRYEVIQQRTYERGEIRQVAD